MNVPLIAKGLFLWMALVSTAIGMLLQEVPENMREFYRFGPHNDLRIMGIAIDTTIKYVGVAMYCICNSILRNLHTDVLYAWLMNNVQDSLAEKTHYIRRHAYFVSLVHSIYYWWDWFIYINILLAQFDLFLMEMGASICTALSTTYFYLKHDPGYHPLY
jgi:hypothetical protein